MSILSLNTPGTVTPGTATAVSGQDINKTFWYANGGPLDQIDIEATLDGSNWVKIAGRQAGSLWTQSVVGKFASVRLNRIALDPVSLPSAFVGANDIVPSTNQGGGSGATALGQFTIASALNVPTNTLVPTLLASFGTQADGSYQVEIDLVYRNTGTLTVGSRKVTGTVRRYLGALTIEAQQNPATYLNDNVAFGANIATVLALSGTTIQLLVNSVGAATTIDWTASGVINFAA